MRVEERFRSRQGVRATGKVKLNRRVESSPFAEVLSQNQSPSLREEMGGLLRKLDEQGRRLVHSRTLVELNHYKKLVHHILEWTAREGVGLSEKQLIDGRGRSRIYRHVQTINAELVALTDSILRQEESRLAILEKVGQIKGLLLQLNG